MLLSRAVCLRHICTVWKAYLEGMVQVTTSRTNDCENYRSHICEPIKTFRLHKEQQLKRVRMLEPQTSLSVLTFQFYAVWLIFIHWFYVLT